MLNLVSAFRLRRHVGEDAYLAEMPSSRYSFVLSFEVKSASRHIMTSRNAVEMRWARWRPERNWYVSRVWGVRPNAHWVGGFTLKRNFTHLCGRPPKPPRAWTSDLLKLFLNVLLCILSTLSEFVEPRRIKVQTTRLAIVWGFIVKRCGYEVPVPGGVSTCCDRWNLRRYLRMRWI